MSDPSYQWFDLKTLLAIGGLMIGFCGLCFGFFTHRWVRGESRGSVLGKILEPMIRCAQCLFRANTSRKKCEQLKHSYPDPEKTPEVVQRVNSFIEEYGKLLKSSEMDFREAESKFSSQHFRFPDAISKSIKTTLETLSEMGRLVNDGLFDKADIQLAKFRDEYKQVTDTARGWRLADPFEGILNRFRKHKPKDEEQIPELELTQKEMDGVLELLHKRVTTQSQNSFVVHPPMKILDNLDLLKDDKVIDELRDSVFSVVFQDGTAKMLSLPELMAFIFNLIQFAEQSAELNAMVQAAQPKSPREYKVSFQFTMREIMQPEMVKALLDKITFSDSPSDG